MSDTSSSCGAGLHGMCPGYYKTAYTCRCACHRQASPQRPLEGDETQIGDENVSGHRSGPSHPAKVHREGAGYPLPLVFLVSQRLPA